MIHLTILREPLPIGVTPCDVSRNLSQENGRVKESCRESCGLSDSVSLIGALKEKDAEICTTFLCCSRFSSCHVTNVNEKEQ